MLQSLRHSFRLLHVAFTLARHGALFLFDAVPVSPVLVFCCRIFAAGGSERKKAERLRRAVERMGPSFIKLGQSLSTRADLIGEEMATALADLRDSLPAFPAAIARQTVEEELGASLADLFADFENVPAAAASIAQVHFATLKDGRKVAVKILRPDIERSFARDIDFFLWLARLVERQVPSLRRMKPVEMVMTFKRSVDFELDLRYEASAAVELRGNLKNDSGFYVTDIHWPLTARRVMTAERIKGIPIADIISLRLAGHNPDDVLRKLVISFFQQAFRDGYFHADLHPGNLFVLPNGNVAAVDFGIMGRLAKKDRIYLALILRGFLKEDYHFLAKVHVDAGYVPPKTDAEQFALSLMAITKPIIGKSLSEISVARLLAQLFRNAEVFQMEVQPQLLLLQKTMMVAEGVGRMLNPSVNMWEIAEPLVEQWGKENVSPRAQLRAGIRELLRHSARLPEIMKKLELALDKYLAEKA